MAEARGPLSGTTPIVQPNLGVLALAPGTAVTVRGRASTAALVDALAGALGGPPPVAPNTVAALGTRTVLWLAPGEWRIVAPDGDAPVLLDALQAVPRALAGVTDVSDFFAAIRLSGGAARDVLAQGCPLDLHPRVFGPGHCAQSLLAKAEVLLHQRDDQPSFDLYVRWSLARYLWDWLATAAGTV